MVKKRLIFVIIGIVTGAVMLHAQNEFPAKSPLSEGDCYKIRVEKTGVFKITGKNLKDMGMDIASVNPKNLKVYGMTGGVLPELNPETPSIGIRELAIFVNGQNNSVLGETDYILFYGEAAHSWAYDASVKCYKHTFNYYDDYNYYFITAAGGEGKRIPTINNNSLTENATTAQGDFYTFHEQDLTNVIKAGRNWVGEHFNSSTRERTFSVNVPNIVTSEKVVLRTGVLASFTSGVTSFSYTVNGTEITNRSFSGGSATKYAILNTSFTASSENLSLKISFTPGGNGSEGWLDYFEIQARRNLVFDGKQMSFRDVKSVDSAKITKFTLQNTTSQTTIWDVTDFYNVTKMTIENNAFKAKTDILREFIAFDNTFETPSFIGKTEKQNLLGMRNIESVIVAHPNFFEEAKKIEDEHRNNLGLKTVLVTTEQVYNEFSSGRQDVGAIRDFMRMLHTTAGNYPPQYLLLVGDASWDYKNTIKQSNFVPTWSSRLFTSADTSIDYEHTLVVDDFFALLDEGEGSSDLKRCKGKPVIAVGRFPVNTADEMQSMVKKRLHYTSKASETMGEWRNVITFVADDPDNPKSRDIYVESCEEHENVILSRFPEAIIEKIYADSYKRVSSPGGTRYPDVNKALTTRVDRGALIVNYVGHGSKFRWSHEALLDVPDLNHWKNFDHMPFIITESCSNAPFDDYEVTTLGEAMVLRPDGGAIGVLGSTRMTYNTHNNTLTNALYRAMLPSAENNYQAKSIGIATMEAKQDLFNGSGNLGNNTQMYTLFGDPTITLSFPQYSIVCTEINGKNAATTIDTISALTIVSFSGEIRTSNNVLKSDFNGVVYPTVFDKEVETKTLGQINGISFPYKMWKSIIFKGAAKVENGKFTFDFFVPKDIDYEYDFSKVVFYAFDETQKIDANGVFSDFVVGGLNPDAPEDTTPPQMKLFMNDTFFVDGGYTNENPVLLALLYDESGINATGSSIGHNITAVLDGDVNNEMNLNNFYQTEVGDYRRGRVAFPLYDLEDGEHTLTVRAWDSYNNSVKESITFVVVGSNRFVIRDLYNYPNPFNDATNFVFEHNVSDETLNVNIRIFDLMGRLVHEIQQPIYAVGYRIPPIRWRGDNGGGALLSGGYYIYQLTVTTSTGATVRKSGKLVISR